MSTSQSRQTSSRVDLAVPTAHWRTWPRVGGALSVKRLVATGLCVALVVTVAAPVPLFAAPKKMASVSTPALLRQVQTSAPGPERDSAVDALIERGDAAWPDVKAALPGLLTSPGGEDVVVDLLLGFGPLAWDEVLAYGPKLGDGPALRLVRQVLKLPKDARQLTLLQLMVDRTDEGVLLLVLPELLARGDNDRVHARLLQLVDDRRPAPRDYAIDALVAARHAPAMAVLVRRLGVERLSPSEENLPLRIKLITAVAHIGADTEAPVPALLEAMELQDQREAALDGLQIVGDPAVKSAIYMLKTADRARIETALLVLAHMRTVAAPQLVPLIAEARDEVTRGLIIDVVAHLGVPEVRSALLDMLRKRAFSNLRQGVELALTLYDAEVRTVMLELLADKDPATRLMVVRELWKLGDTETLPALRNAAARDDNRDVRLTALKAMVGLADPKAVDYLRKLTMVNDQEERLVVIDLLGKVDDDKGVPAMARLLSDPNDAVFRTSLSALRRITWHQGPRREGEWLGWHKRQKELQPEPWQQVETSSKRFVVDGKELGFLVAGPEDGPALVVIAGAPFRDASHLAPHVWRLAETHQVVVLQRGVGTRSGATLSEADQIRELDGLLRKLGRKKVALLADPTASHLALRYAAERKKNITHVVLHGGLWPSQMAISRLPAEVAAAVPAPWSEDLQWAQQQHDLLEASLRRRVMLRGLLAGVLRDPELGRSVKPGALYQDGFELATLDRAVHEAGLWNADRSTVPTLVLLGAKAPWATSALADLQNLPAATKKAIKLIKLDKAAGMPLVDSPEQAVSAIADFVR
jgi:pimeloyl-ACP methyl ester carboxylesterase/HEAT repeat protein